MSEHNSSDHTSVGLIDIASQVPGILADIPVIVRGVVTGMLARPTSKTSIGKVFQDRAARLGDKVFLRFGDQQLTYREANAIANRYAAVLAARGVGRGIARWLPVLGAIGVGAYAWYDTRHVARTAINLFALESAAGHAFDGDEASLYD